MDQFILRGTKQGKQRGSKKQQGRGECLLSGKWGGIIPQTTYTFSTHKYCRYIFRSVTALDGTLPDTPKQTSCSGTVKDT